MEVGVSGLKVETPMHGAVWQNTGSEFAGSRLHAGLSLLNPEKDLSYLKNWDKNLCGPFKS